MSKNNRNVPRASGGEPRNALERMREERRRQEARDKRVRVLVVLGAAFAVLAVTAVVGIVLSNGGSDGGVDAKGSAAPPSGAIGDGVVIPVGKPNAPSTLSVYEDFRCPSCGQFEKAFRATVDQLVHRGKVKVEYHIASFIDNNLPGQGSKNAANAAACAQDQGKFEQYHRVLYAHQPPETDDAFASKQRLISLAGQVSGLKTEAFTHCVKNGLHDSWVAKSQQAFNASGYTSTPTILLNGDSIFPKKGDQQISPSNLVKWVDEANKGHAHR